ncbi:MAG: class I lanthipeptide [Saprospiraceae bacterium]
MKKLSLNPLSLDKSTIAILDSNQLHDVVGGKGVSSSTGGGGGSTGCGSGSSTCRAVGA